MTDRRHRLPFLPLLLAASLGAADAVAAVRVATTNTARDFLAGDFDGTAVTDTGRLSLGAPLLARAWPEDAADAVVLAAAADRTGRVYVATGGGSGRLFASEPDGKIRLLFDAPEPNVTAVAVAPDGTVVCATSPKGKLYRVDPKATDPAKGGTEWGDPGEDAVWSLLFGTDGTLFVATGNKGRIYRKPPGAALALLAETADTHVRTLALAPDGTLLAGTSEKGLLLAVGKDGSVRTLHDFGKPEVTGIAVGADGTVFAAASSTEAPSLAASRADPRGRPPLPTPTPAAAAPSGEAPRGTVSVSTGPARLAASTAPAGREGATDVVLVGKDGLVEPAWTLPEESVYAMRIDPQSGELVLATGPRGRIYTLKDRRLRLVAQTQERQAVAAPQTPSGLAVVTMASAGVLRPAPKGPRKGSFVSTVRDAQWQARFGRLRYDGEVPPGASATFSVRTGNSSKPDETWSAWVALGADGTPPAGAKVPPARFLQWKAELAEGERGASPTLERIDLSYAEANTRPVLENVQVLEPGAVFARSSALSGPAVLSVTNPDESGVFAGLEPPKEPAGPDGGGKKLFRKGYRTVTWRGTDLNADPLRYDVDLLPASGGPPLPLRRDLEDQWVSFDTTALPDGRYRCRVTASDRAANPEGDALSASEETVVFVADNSPPVLKVESARAEKDAVVLTVAATDALSAIVKAEGTVNADRWRVLAAADGVADGTSERFVLRAGRPAGGAFLSVRVVDAAGNSAAVSARFPEEFR